MQKGSAGNNDFGDSSFEYMTYLPLYSLIRAVTVLLAFTHVERVVTF